MSAIQTKAVDLKSLTAAASSAAALAPSSSLQQKLGVKEDFSQALKDISSRDKQNVLSVEKQIMSPSKIRFSQHAIERMNSRGISFSPELVDKLEKATEMAARKGAKETLVLTDQSAMIVNIANNVVVTVMDKNALKENVFTNIDSTVVI